MKNTGEEKPSLSKLLSVEEVAEILHVSVSYTYRLIGQGKLPYINVGGRLRRVHPDDLRVYMQKNHSQQPFGS